MPNEDRRSRDDVAPDGSPVEVYRVLPPLGEADVIHAAISSGAAVLELGCGTGRITHRLLDLGHPVTAVDQSAAMLKHVRGAETVLADIETLALDQRFDAVVLASNLVNTADEHQRGAFLSTCARHVAPSGSVLIQRYPTDWDPALDPADEQLGDIRLRLIEGRRDGPHVTGVIEYSAGGQKWRHRFTGYILEDGELERELRRAKLTIRRYLDEPGSWVEAGEDVGS